MGSSAMDNDAIIEQFFRYAKEHIRVNLESDVRIRPIRVGVRYDIASYHALGCANWPNLRLGTIKPVEKTPVWHAFQAWLAERQLQATWVFCCDKAGVYSWWELTTLPINSG